MDDYKSSSMVSVRDKYNDILVEYDCTISTDQFENLKPKLSCSVNSWEDAGAVLKVMRKILNLEHTDIKSKRRQ